MFTSKLVSVGIGVTKNTSEFVAKITIKRSLLRVLLNLPKVYYVLYELDAEQCLAIRLPKHLSAGKYRSFDKTASISEEVYNFILYKKTLQGTTDAIH